MSDAPTQGWLVELSIPQTASVIKKPVEDRIVIGRIDKLKGTTPDVDLTAWGGLEFGVDPTAIWMSPLSHRPPGLLDSLLGAPQLGRRHQLHGAGDLLGAPDAVDAPSNVAECRHGCGLPPQALAAAMNSALHSWMQASMRPRRASAISFFSANSL